MANRTTAVRYARALADALPGAQELTEAHTELIAAVELMQRPEARDTIGSAVMPGRQRAELTERVFSAVGFRPVVRRIVTLLAESNQLAILPDIAAEVGEICDRRNNIVAAELTTAIDLTAEKQDEYRRSLERATGRKVRLQTRVDPSILGGAVTRIGSEVFDGSVRRHMERLHQKLKGE